MGRVHGRAFPKEIAEIAAIRLELAVAQGRFRDEDPALRVAAKHLPLLRAFDEDLYEELLGIAEGAGIEAAKVVVLNHYTDLKDLDPEGAGEGPGEGVDGEDEGDHCSAIWVRAGSEPLLAQTWDMHGSAMPYVLLLEVPSRRGRPAQKLLSITGCVGMAGINAAGLSVTINNLKSRDGRVGVLWPALVRRMLREPSVRGATHLLFTAPMGSGHHYLLADREEAVAIETSGLLKEVVFRYRPGRPRRPGVREERLFFHTNHCVGEHVKEVSWVAPTSTTYERYAWLKQSFEASASGSLPESPEALWARLGSHEGYPRSLCTHLATEASPHAMATCAGVLMRPRSSTLWASAGCLHEATPERFTFESEP
jgi:isopenicillin-N N-acyltransferase-like protein